MRENGNNDQYIREKRSEKCCYHELVAGTYQSIPAFIGKLMERGFNYTYIGSCLMFALLRTLSVDCFRGVCKSSLSETIEFLRRNSSYFALSITVSQGKTSIIASSASFTRSHKL